MNDDVIVDQISNDGQSRRFDKNELDRLPGRSDRVRKVFTLPKINEAPMSPDLAKVHGSSTTIDCPETSANFVRVRRIEKEEDDTFSNSNSIQNRNSNLKINCNLNGPVSAAFAKQMAAARARSTKNGGTWYNEDCSLPGAIIDHRRTHSLDRYPSKMENKRQVKIAIRKNGFQISESKIPNFKRELRKVMTADKDSSISKTIDLSTDHDRPKLTLRLPSIHQGNFNGANRNF